MKILVACEESQRVCEAFRKRGHESYSCDIQECSGGYPEWHIRADVVPLVNGDRCFITQDNVIHHIDTKWDMVIAFPPCTYLTVSGNRWFDVERYGENAIIRHSKRLEAINFFMLFPFINCDKIAIENPVGIMSSYYRKPDQIIQPYHFGEPVEKKTCLWLKGLPKLLPTNEIVPSSKRKFDSGKSMSEWYAATWNLPKEERAKVRSKTFQGIADAMAEQWG